MMSAVSTLLAVAVLSGRLQSGQPPPPPSSPPAVQTQTAPPQKPATLDETIGAGEAETEEPARKLVKWNEFDGKHLTFRFGGGFLYEASNYTQDENSKEQFTLVPDNKVRDFRLTFKGRLKFIESREVTYTSGI